MMKKIVLILTMMVWLCSLGAQVTFAQLGGGLQFPGPGIVSTSGGGGCTNILDFSVACNSQYIPIF